MEGLVPLSRNRVPRKTDPSGGVEKIEHAPDIADQPSRFCGRFIPVRVEAVGLAHGAVVDIACERDQVILDVVGIFLAAKIFKVQRESIRNAFMRVVGCIGVNDRLTRRPLPGPVELAGQDVTEISGKVFGALANTFQEAFAITIVGQAILSVWPEKS